MNSLERKENEKSNKAYVTSGSSGGNGNWLWQRG